MENQENSISVTPVELPVNVSPSSPQSVESFDTEEFEYFNNLKGVYFDEISSKCLIFSIIEEYLKLDGVVLENFLRKRLEFVIEPNWRTKYIKL